MFHLENIQKAYKIAYKHARCAFEHKEYNKVFHWCRVCAQIAYQVNWIYCDDEIENLLVAVAEDEIKVNSLVPNPERICFYDAFFLDYRGLSLQYLRALLAAGKEVLVVCQNPLLDNSAAMQEELRENPRCHIVTLPPGQNSVERMHTIYSHITNFAPTALLMHLEPFSVEAIAAFSALRGVKRCQINLTDHVFWLGVKCLDFSLEFRNYGCTVSLEKRGIPADKIKLLPYYPVTGKEPFAGFPLPTTGKVIVVSGAVSYKIMGKNDTFFHLVKDILEQNPNVVFFFAGGGNLNKFKRFLQRHKLENRCGFLGARRDINEVIAHCDIYLATYPITGGLMSQYAAANGKPILAWNSSDLPINNLEEFVCIHRKTHLTITDFNEFSAEARHLVDDCNYRHERGELLRNAMENREYFEKNVAEFLLSGNTLYSWDTEPIPYSDFTDLYLSVASNEVDTLKKILLKNFGIHTIKMIPEIFWEMPVLVWYYFAKKKIDLLIKREK